MKLKTLVKKTVQEFALGLKTQSPSAKRIKLENLQITQPRSNEEIKRAFREGRIAEMTPHQAGL